jgi:predicted alpha/beta-hydrolase family hydrolase
MTNAARALAARRIVTATFDFPYMAAGRKVPDGPEVLERAWRDVVDTARANEKLARLPLFIGGKSMGGRIASQAAAASDLPIEGLVFLGYPLHPPGKPDQRRDKHLPAIRAPMLFVQGTRDAFGTAEEIRGLLPRLQRAALFEVDGGDHSFKVPAKSAVPQSAVFEAVYDRVAEFVFQRP